MDCRGTRFSPVAGSMARGGLGLQRVIRDSAEGAGLPAYLILRD